MRSGTALKWYFIDRSVKYTYIHVKKHFQLEIILYNDFIIILLCTVKYANLAGGKKLSTVKNFGQVKFAEKIWNKNVERNKRIFNLAIFMIFSQFADVSTAQWRHRWWKDFAKRCQSKICAHCQHFIKKFKAVQKISKKKSFRGGGGGLFAPKDARRVKRRRPTRKITAV